ncbi:hypothetical protein N9K75_01170 [bacterium]|nr:hypothetical protein [bacterium]
MQQQHYPQSSYNNVNNTNNTRVKKIYMSENNINENSVLFSESVKNKIIQDSLFTRIIYSNELFSTNAILYSFDLIITNASHFYNKYLYRFNPFQNSLSKIKKIEKNILSSYAQLMKTSPRQKLPQYKILEVIDSGCLKTFASNNNTNDSDLSITHKKVRFCLKILGVWESNDEYGIIYKLSPH